MSGEDDLIIEVVRLTAIVSSNTVQELLVVVTRCGGSAAVTFLYLLRRFESNDPGSDCRLPRIQPLAMPVATLYVYMLLSDEHVLCNQRTSLARRSTSSNQRRRRYYN